MNNLQTNNVLKRFFLISIFLFCLAMMPLELQCGFGLFRQPDMFQGTDIGKLHKGMSKIEVNSKLDIFEPEETSLIAIRTFEIPQSISGPDKKIEVVIAKINAGLTEE